MDGNTDAEIVGPVEVGADQGTPGGREGIVAQIDGEARPDRDQQGLPLLQPQALSILLGEHHVVAGEQGTLVEIVELHLCPDRGGPVLPEPGRRSDRGPHPGEGIGRANVALEGGPGPQPRDPGEAQAEAGLPLRTGREETAGGGEDRVVRLGPDLQGRAAEEGEVVVVREEPRAVLGGEAHAQLHRAGRFLRDHHHHIHLLGRRLRLQESDGRRAVVPQLHQLLLGEAHGGRGPEIPGTEGEARANEAGGRVAVAADDHLTHPHLGSRLCGEDHPGLQASGVQRDLLRHPGEGMAQLPKARLQGLPAGLDLQEGEGCPGLDGDHLPHRRLLALLDPGDDQLGNAGARTLGHLDHHLRPAPGRISDQLGIGDPGSEEPVSTVVVANLVQRPSVGLPVEDRAGIGAPALGSGATLGVGREAGEGIDDLLLHHLWLHRQRALGGGADLPDQLIRGVPVGAEKGDALHHQSHPFLDRQDQRAPPPPHRLLDGGDPHVGIAQPPVALLDPGRPLGEGDRIQGADPGEPGQGRDLLGREARGPTDLDPGTRPGIDAHGEQLVGLGQLWIRRHGDRAHARPEEARLSQQGLDPIQALIDLVAHQVVAPLHLHRRGQQGSRQSPTSLEAEGPQPAAGSLLDADGAGHQAPHGYAGLHLDLDPIEALPGIGLGQQIPRGCDPALPVGLPPHQTRGPQEVLIGEALVPAEDHLRQPQAWRGHQADHDPGFARPDIGLHLLEAPGLVEQADGAAQSLAGQPLPRAQGNELGGDLGVLHPGEAQLDAGDQRWLLVPAGDAGACRRRQGEDEEQAKEQAAPHSSSHRSFRLTPRLPTSDSRFSVSHSAWAEMVSVMRTSAVARWPAAPMGAE